MMGMLKQAITTTEELAVLFKTVEDRIVAGLKPDVYMRRQKELRIDDVAIFNTLRYTLGTFVTNGQGQVVSREEVVQFFDHVCKDRQGE